jgi:cobalt/nickel transport protein
MKYWLEIITVAAIVVFAILFLVQNALIQGTLKPGDQAYTGSDEAATKIINETGYQRWATPLWEPPSSEIESLIFSLQAAIGSVIIGYFFGYYRGKKDGEKSR